MYFSQVESALRDSEFPSSLASEKKEWFKTKLSVLAQDYANVKQDLVRFPLGREHLRAIHELTRERDIVISRPDKGSGVVLLDLSEYNAKMMEILGDRSKFERLGSCDEHDRTELNERALQSFLLRQYKDGRIGESIYKRVRPSGSTRPRMYGLPKVHKPAPIPLRPILSMVGSAQHEMARWLAEILQPVLRHYSKYVVADSFEFCRTLGEHVNLGENVFMYSFDVRSLFTNVPIEETIQICLDALYRCDVIEAPNEDEELIRKLLVKCTQDVEFSFNGMMYRQIDGVAMGSPLGPVLANIFLGHCETLIPEDRLPALYRRYVDDTFSLFVGGRSEALRFLELLNSLYPSLQFTMEGEHDRRMPFLDVHVFREAGGFRTSVYRKPTFTGLYTRWDSYCATSTKISLIRSLTLRAMRICSPGQLEDEIGVLKNIFARNGYPQPIVDRVISQARAVESPLLGAALRPCYIRLPWVGRPSSLVKEKIMRATKTVAAWCRPVCCFTSRNAFATAKKDVLPAESTSNVIYLFSCECGRSYVGRTSLRLSERMKQHVPESLLALDGHDIPLRGRGRPRKTDQTCAAAANSVSSRTRSRTAATVKAANTTMREGDKELALTTKVRTDTAIGRHLKESTSCRQTVCRNVKSHFRILSVARSADHLQILEAEYIACLQPALCSQKEHVRTLSLTK